MPRKRSNTKGTNGQGAQNPAHVDKTDADSKPDLSALEGSGQKQSEESVLLTALGHVQEATRKTILSTPELSDLASRMQSASERFIDFDQISGVTPLNTRSPELAPTNRKLPDDLIRNGGNHTPLLCRPAPGSPQKLEVIDGSQRYLAFKELRSRGEFSHLKVRAHVVEMTDQEALIFVGDRNEFRAEFNDLEQSHYYLRLLHHGIVESVGALPAYVKERDPTAKMSRTGAVRKLSLARLPVEFQELVIPHKVSAQAVEDLTSLLTASDSVSPSKKELQEQSLTLTEPYKLTDKGKTLFSPVFKELGSTKSNVKEILRLAQKALGSTIKTQKAPPPIITKSGETIAISITKANKVSMPIPSGITPEEMSEIIQLGFETKFNFSKDAVTRSKNDKGNNDE